MPAKHIYGSVTVPKDKSRDLRQESPKKGIKRRHVSHPRICQIQATRDSEVR